MRRIGAHSAARRVALRLPHSLDLAITREVEKRTQTSGAGVCTKRNPALLRSYLRTRHFSLSSSSSGKTHLPQETDSRPTTHSLAPRVTRNKKTRHLFGFLMVFLRSRTTINYDFNK